MKRRAVFILGLLILAGTRFLADSPAQSNSREPAGAQDVEYTEEVQVRLVLLDVVVLDSQGRAVADLNLDDFEVIVGGDEVPLESLDVDCPARPEGDSRAADVAPRPAARSVTERPRRIVLALDYQHLDRKRRFRVLEQVIAMVRAGGAEGDEIMIVALNGGLRIEQRFTRDVDRIVSSLERMQYDVTLWQPTFHHLNESGFVGGMTAMLEYLATVSGAKAVILFSEMGHVPLEHQFKQIAAVAAAARCLIYPVDAGGLVPVEPPDIGFPPLIATVSTSKSVGRSGGKKYSPG